MNKALKLITLIVCGSLLLLITLRATPAQRKKQTQPCAAAQSQAEMNICWGKEYKKADVELNAVYQKLVAMLDEEQKTQLKEAQLAWLKYRDLHCEFAADQYKGGSLRPTIMATCLLDVTTTRTTELQEQIKERNL